MSFLEIVQISLPILLSVAGLILLILLIILTIRVLKAMNRVEEIIEDVDKKVKSLNGVFHIIDFFTDKISSLTDKIVEKITNFVIGIGKKKYNNEEEELENE